MQADPSHEAAATPARPSDPLRALLASAVEKAEPGPARTWLRALLEHGEAAQGPAGDQGA